MTAIEDALLRGDREQFTRQPPKTPLAQIRLLMRAEKGSTRAVAARLGVSQRTVERYLAGTRKTPRPQLRAALVREAAKAWQPRVRRQARKRAATSGGITIETRARFGYTAPIGTTDDPRERRLTVHLPAPYAARLFDAQQQGAGDRELRDIVAEGLQEVYFKDGGGRAAGLEVDITDIVYFDVSF
ncbi:helix-turn-helix domain-containing protein [Streptacidiphilus sp. PB12-B1b]|uniref:telomere-protecting terminal protein Tpg n=1 Tax=Streptacidiphilus sp. PB12-B1b TaxID=2705012 RepID=UPI0015FDD886|nr:helix-turn-helix domain-containing protein [Streptacidiphilus sp. PB12-B1b]QMU77315.1 helix-turn-helix domain-containing protein [Streptacidiphilus sp. PB12-B1b]